MFFSIILYVYNGEDYVSEAIDSVIKQDFLDWELIIVNDGSYDKTKVICDEKKKKDNRLVVIHKENTGVSDSRNKALEIAQGNWIVFIDADDCLSEYSLRFLYEQISNHECDLFVGEYHMLRDNTIIAQKSINSRKDTYKKQEIKTLIDFSLRQSQWYEDEWYGNMRPVWAKCFKRDVIVKNNIQFCKDLKYGEDMIFVLRFLANCEEVFLLNRLLYFYRDNPNSVMNKKLWKGVEQGELYYELAEQYTKEFASEESLRDMWLETAERDWRDIIVSSLSWKEKYKAFKELYKRPLYIRFCKKTEIYSSRKQEIYVNLISKKYVVPLMLMTYYRTWKHIKRIKKSGP